MSACKCDEYGDNPKCFKHGEGTDWARAQYLTERSKFVDGMRETERSVMNDLRAQVAALQADLARVTGEREQIAKMYMDQHKHFLAVEDEYEKELSAERARAKGMEEAGRRDAIAEVVDMLERRSTEGYFANELAKGAIIDWVRDFSTMPEPISPSPAKEPPIGTCSCHSGSVCGEACHRGCHHDGCGRGPKPLPAVEKPCAICQGSGSVFPDPMRDEIVECRDCPPAVAPVESLTEDGCESGCGGTGKIRVTNNGKGRQDRPCPSGCAPGEGDR